jgi:SAM-dependent methyltransferase
MKRPWNGNIHYHPLVLAALPGGTSRVLDVGCGDGILIEDLIDAGVPRVVGLDLDLPVLDRARARIASERVDWKHGDVLHLDFEPGSFDAVVSVAALHQMDAERALERFAQLVRPGGVVAIVGLAAADWWDLPPEAFALALRTALGIVRGHWQHTAPMTWPPPLTYRETKILARRVLPGSLYRRHLLGRYSLVWRKPLTEHTSMRSH